MRQPAVRLAAPLPKIYKTSGRAVIAPAVSHPKAIRVRSSLSFIPTCDGLSNLQLLLNRTTGFVAYDSR